MPYLLCLVYDDSTAWNPSASDPYATTHVGDEAAAALGNMGSGAVGPLIAIVQSNAPDRVRTRAVRRWTALGIGGRCPRWSGLWEPTTPYCTMPASGPCKVSRREDGKGQGMAGVVQQKASTLFSGYAGGS